MGQKGIRKGPRISGHADELVLIVQTFFHICTWSIIIEITARDDLLMPFFMPPQKCDF